MPDVAACNRELRNLVGDRLDLVFVRHFGGVGSQSDIKSISAPEGDGIPGLGTRRQAYRERGGYEIALIKVNPLLDDILAAVLAWQRSCKRFRSEEGLGRFTAIVAMNLRSCTMGFMPAFAFIALVLILARAITELWLSQLNQHHVRAHVNEVPPAFRGIIDEAIYRRSVEYTLAKSRFGDIADVFDVVVLIAVLFSGVLPWAFGRFSASFGSSILAMAGFFFVIGIALSIPGLPFAWHAQFKLEERFGFNTTSIKTWILDRVKGFLLAVLLGYPLLALVLKLIEWTGANWWLWAAAVVIAFQLLLLLTAPAVIMPLFNTFTPLPHATLR